MSALLITIILHVSISVAASAVYRGLELGPRVATRVGIAEFALTGQ